MTTRMHLASTEERNAAFDAVYQELVHGIPSLPWMARGPAKEFLDSPAGKVKVLEIVDVALDAAEAVAKKPA